LVLITYHLGDAAGHSFHDYAGYAEIVFAFGAFFALDAILIRVFRDRAASPGMPVDVSKTGIA
jgi:hypothetical protein